MLLPIACTVYVIAVLYTAIHLYDEFDLDVEGPGIQAVGTAMVILWAMLAAPFIVPAICLRWLVRSVR